jgi:hypothetical protein
LLLISITNNKQQGEALIKYLSRINLLTIIILSILSVIPAKSQSTEDSLKIVKYKGIAKQIVSLALKEGKGYEALKNLCRIGPRLSGSRNSFIAINWAKNKLNELGLDSVWLQPVLVPNWKRGNIEEAVIINTLTLAVKRLSILAIGGSVATPPKGITANVIEVKTFKELEKRKEEVNGKLVFFSRPIDQSILNTFSAYSEAADQRMQGAIEAAKYGAVGVIVRSLTTKYDNIPHTGMLHYNDSIPKIQAVTVGYQDADFLSNVLIKDPNMKFKLKLNCESLPDVESYNVIGEIEGTEFPNEVIVIGGHIDSWDVGHGAHDDGAGCVQAIEVLDLFKRLNIKPKRTIRVVLFMSEEFGSYGGKEYGVYADTSVQIHLAAIESDRGAYSPEGFNVDTDSTELIDRVKSWLPYLQFAGINWVRKGGSGSDINKIKNAKLLAGYVPDDQRYFDVHHSQSDVFDEVHPRELELGSAAMAILAYLLSEEGLQVIKN